MELPMTFKRRAIKESIGIGIMVFFPLLFNISFLLEQISTFNHKHINSIVLREERFQPLKTFLPQQGVVSYISDIKPQKEINKYQKTYLATYYLTQYALSPLLIVNNRDHSLVIGDFDSNITPGDVEFKDLLLLRDFGQGLMLFERRDR
jgi:hypothetical protein